MKISILLLVLLNLPGCSLFKSKGLHDYGGTEPPHIQEARVLSKLQEYCDENKTEVGFAVSPTKSSSEEAYLANDTVCKFLVVRETLINSTYGMNKGLLEEYYGRGVAIAYVNCDRFFARLTATSANLEQLKDNMTISSAFYDTILGLTVNNAKIVGGVAASLDFTSGAISNLQKNYLLSPDIYEVQKLVRSEQRLFDKSVNRNNFRDISEVEMALNDFSYHCTFGGIKTLLNETVRDKLTQNNDPVTL